MAKQTIAHISSKTQIQPALNGWQMFLTDQGRSPHTIKAFLADIRLMASYFPPDLKLGNISTTDINNFLGWMENERGVPCSPKTLSRRITSIKAFFRWLTSGGVILVDPAEKVVQKSVMSPTPEVLTQDEIKAVVDVAESYLEGKKKDLRYYTLVRLLLSTGIKKGELLNLETIHVDLDNPSGPILFVRYGNPQHRYKERKIALPEDWIDKYQNYIEDFDLKDRLFPWSPRRLEYLLEDLSNEAGLSKHLSFDMCRWTCALTDWDAGMEPDKIRQKLGISKVQWREVRMKLRRLSSKGK
jgi:site-specific recombinase XerD